MKGIPKQPARALEIAEPSIDVTLCLIVSVIGPGLVLWPPSRADKNNKMKTGKLETSTIYPSVATTGEIDVYANWGKILMRMTYCSVGIDPRTVIQNNISAVAEPEFTPVDLFYVSRQSEKK